MHTDDIQKRIDAIAATMSGRTKVCAVNFEIGASVEPRAYIRHNPKLSSNWNDEEGMFFKVGRDGDTIDAILTAAQAWASKLPTREETDLAIFRDKLADTIEHGNRIGVDIEVVNPLMEAMKRLSENVLTHQPVEAA